MADRHRRHRDTGDVTRGYLNGNDLASSKGYIEATGGYLCAGDCRAGDDGLPLAEIMPLANDSPARNKIIILDSCHSGARSQVSSSMLWVVLLQTWSGKSHREVSTRM